MERGHTEMRAFRGSDYIIDSRLLEEWFWESQPKRVKASYAKSDISQQDPEYHETRGTLWEYAGTTP